MWFLKVTLKSELVLLPIHFSIHSTHGWLDKDNRSPGVWNLQTSVLCLMWRMLTGQGPKTQTLALSRGYMF